MATKVRVVSTLAGLTSTQNTKASLTDGQIIRVAADGGEWKWDAASTATASAIVKAHDDGGTGRFVRQLGDVVSVRDFGWSDAGTATEQTAAINLALASGLPIELPSGFNATINGELDYSACPALFCGAGNAVFDASGQAASGFANNATLFGEGSLTALPALDADVSATSTIVLASAPTGLTHGSRIILHDTADNSYSGFRAQYRQGESAIVNSVSGATVTLHSRLIGDYPSATTAVWLVNPISPRLDGFTVLAPGSETSAQALVRGIYLGIAEFAELNAIRVVGSENACIALSRNFGTILRAPNVRGDLTQNNGAAKNYGIAILNCEDIRIEGGQAIAYRHGVTVGGDNAVGGIVNRRLLIDGLTAINDGASITTSVDFHVNVEDIAYDRCRLYGGIYMGGDRNAVRNSFIAGDAAIGHTYAVHISEAKGFNFAVENCNIFFRTATGSSYENGRGIINCGGNEDSITSNTTVGGIFRISDTNIYYIRDGIVRLIRFLNKGAGGTFTVRLDNVNEYSLSGGAANRTIIINTSSGSGLRAIVNGGNIEEGDCRSNSPKSVTRNGFRSIEVTSAQAIPISANYVKIVGPASGTYAITLASPAGTNNTPLHPRLGKPLVIEMQSTTSTNAVTLALTNVEGGSASSSASFDAAGEKLVLMAANDKWMVMKEIGVTLS